LVSGTGDVILPLRLALPEIFEHRERGVMVGERDMQLRVQGAVPVPPCPVEQQRPHPAAGADMKQVLAIVLR
jgi:hypothetical protein